ncbi:YhdP family protein [Phycobacter sp. K97]|uniref:YhdP family protein n=1 Tax=Phycobacter sedimenti TaxID=3133977 RepID=UPI00311F9D4C
MADKGKEQIDAEADHVRPDPADRPDASASVSATSVPGPNRAAETAVGGFKVARLRGRKWLRYFVYLLLAVSLLVGGALYFGIGMRLSVPDWVRQRVETRLEQNLGGLEIEFGQVHMVVNRGWRPTIGLRDVILRQADGAAVARLADAEISLAMRPLLRGRFQPKKVWLSGLFAALRRDADGNFAISFSDTGTPLRSASDLPKLIETWDSQLERPGLLALSEVTTEAVTLRYEDGRINRVWTLDGGSVRLLRDGRRLSLSSGFSVLSGRQYVGSMEANYRSDIGDASAEFGFLFNDIASEDISAQAPVLGWLQALRAPISGSLRGGIGSTGELLSLAASLQIGQGVIQPSPETLPVPIKSAHSYFTYFPAEQALQFDELKIQSGWVSGMMEGRAELSGIQNGRLTELVGQLRVSDLEINPGYLYDAPLKFAGLRADFRLHTEPFRLEVGEMLVRDGETRVLLDGSAAAGPEGWTYALNGKVDEISVQRVKELWPAAAPPKPREWVRENLFTGTFKDGEVALRGEGRGRPFLHLDTSFSDVNVRFQKNLPPLQGASGHFNLHGTRLVAIASSGHVTADEGGRIDVAGTSFIIPDTSVKGGAPGIARVEASGPITAALSLLDRPPLEVMSKAGLPVDLAQAAVRLAGTLSVPLRTGVAPEEILYHYSGEVTDVTSRVLVPGQEVRSERLTIRGDQGHVELSGEGTLSGVPLTATWRQEIGAGVDPTSFVTGDVALSEDVVTTFNIGLPPGTVFGAGTGRYSLRLTPGVPPELSLTSVLAGIGLRIPSLDWRKPPEAEGVLDMIVTLRAQPSVDRLRIDAAGLRAEGTVTTQEDGGLDRAVFSSVSLGGWMDGPVSLIGRGAAPPELRMDGGRIDMRAAPFTSSSGGSGSSGTGAGGIGPVTLNLDRLQVTDSIALTGFAGRFSVAGGFRGEFRASLNGQTPLSGILLPEGGGTATRIKSADAGGIFRSAGVLRHGQGGSFDMTLVPAARAGEYDGRMTVRNTRIKDAPSMAALVNAISLVGLVNELSGQGILFAEVEAKFRLGATHLIVHESSAVGPSIGLSMDGNYNLNTTALDMRGVISPLYMLNAIGSVLTRKGEGLIGFSFRLRGTADDPAVQVNPLSALAPGMFRELFRGRTPQVPGQTPAAEVPSSGPLAPEKPSAPPENSQAGER